MLSCQGIRLLYLFSSTQKTAQPEPRQSPISISTGVPQPQISVTTSFTIQKPIAAVTKLAPASPVRRNSFEKRNNHSFNLASIDTPSTSPVCEQGRFDISTPSWTTLSDSNYEDERDAQEAEKSPVIFEHHQTITSPVVHEVTAIVPQAVVVSKVDQVKIIERKKAVFTEYVPNRQKFEWKQGGSKVYVTGTFDNWEKTTMLSMSRNKVFETTLNLPRTQKIYFKFIVDGAWVCSNDYETEKDEHGNVNNVLPAIEKSLI